MSVSAEVLLHDLNARGAEITVNGDRIHIEAPPGTLTREVREAVVLYKPELLKLLDPTTETRRRRAELRDLGARLGWPPIQIRPGHTLKGGQAAWETFTTFPPRDGLDEALEAALAILETASGKDQPCLRPSKLSEVSDGRTTA